MKTTILRIEHPEDGVGIFFHRTKGELFNPFKNDKKASTFNYDSYKIGGIRERHENMPGANKEMYNFQSGKHFCAYPSVDIMKKWINCTEIKQLIEIGFVVLLLDVTDCYISEYQAIYTKESIVSSKDITELFK